QKEIDAIEAQTMQSGFWNNAEDARAIMQRMAQLKEQIEPYLRFVKETEEMDILIQLGTEEDESSLIPEIENKLSTLEKDIQALEFTMALSGPHDISNAFLTIHPGAGGTESCDWASMLLRMYLRWIENKGYQANIIDFLPGDEAGVKGVTVQVTGKYAYGYLKAEKGIHRLVRISPFDANKRRHTSFASVFVMPEVEDVEVEINEDDLKIDTYHSSGAGGQHVNVADSAVRITHLPTGTVVTCQNERSQHKNKASAMHVLRARLYECQQEQQKETMSKIGGEKKEIAWGSQIRSYVFQPYTLIKDHRTGFEMGDIQKVMDGGISPFIEAYLFG
ncbi:peptide chain release factor 2, partial [Candidatus Desantisbacteria bacterium]|nr:peptide chain release factor 2 [Candidatus Desantisbacteria bacterium]